MRRAAPVVSEGAIAVTPGRLGAGACATMLDVAMQKQHATAENTIFKVSSNVGEDAVNLRVGHGFVQLAQASNVTYYQPTSIPFECHPRPTFPTLPIFIS